MTKREDTRIIFQKKPKTKIGDLLLLYEVNFIYLVKLFPQIGKNSNLLFFLPESNKNSKVFIKFQKDSQYTSTLLIKQSDLLNSDLISTKMEIAVYHDLKMAEVRKFNGKRIFWIRNKYPNENMFHKDEKFQWNKFLSEWLIFSQKEGLSSYIVKVDAQS